MKTKALIVVDVQNDFCPSGALPVPAGDEVVPVINDLMLNGGYDVIVLTQDWHPANHVSFLNTWPQHCIQGTFGAEFHPDLRTELANAIIRKGTKEDVDSYSGFMDDDSDTTGLRGLLVDYDIDEVHVVGLAFEFCVKATAADAATHFNTSIIRKGCRAIDPSVDTSRWGLNLI